MLNIRPSQFASFEGALVREFADNLARYVHDRWPAFARAAGGSPALRDLVDASVKRARAFGFSRRDHVATWVDWECEFGAQFYELEKWEWFLAILKNGLDPAIRVHRIEYRLQVLRNRGTL